ncbi:MAG: TonB family protein [Arenimonas sp.]
MLPASARRPRRRAGKISRRSTPILAAVRSQARTHPEIRHGPCPRRPAPVLPRCQADRRDQRRDRAARRPADDADDADADGADHAGDRRLHPTRVEIKPLVLPVMPRLPLPHTQVIPVRTPVAISEEVVEPVDQTVGAMDTQAVDTVGVSNTFEAQEVVPPFAQLATITAPSPPYPKMAETRHISGTVTLRIHVDAGGLPIEVLVENSSGSAILDQAALKVVKARWRFVPATSGGVPVAAWAMVPIEFVLD